MAENEQKQFVEQVQGMLEYELQQDLSTLLEEHRSSEIAEVVELFDTERRLKLLDLLDIETAADVVVKVDEATRHELFCLMPEDRLIDIIAELDADDAADVLGELPEDRRAPVLSHLSFADARRIRGLMRYAEDSAGGIMDPVLVSVYEDATIKEAINKIQDSEIDEDFFTIFVVDRAGKYIGDVRIRTMLTRSETIRVKDIVETDTIHVHVDDDQEEVRNIFKKNELIVVPVLDKNDRLVGRITADRIIEVAEEEAAEDIYAMAGTDAAELQNFSVVHAAGVRMTWLLPCLAGTTITAIIGLAFRGVFSQTPEMLFIFTTAYVFVPMIAAISGNAGLQTSAIVVAGLATGDLAALELRQVFAREVRVAALVALSCGVIGCLTATLLPYMMPQLFQNTGPGSKVAVGADGEIEPDAGSDGRIGTDMSAHLRIVGAFSVAMFAAIMVATTLGLFLPFLFRKIGVDPAISSGPLVTTANDSISATIYLSLTLLLVRHLV
ncbi:Magnesium transporter MgtE [Anaerohalosphaera lusitana]|uniref:Magnesium transporter MgtE n=1 Tax=Anaerohalosphaera lusitana TaxID=1936003 RepID=A0A1U9NND2_9BACT|nr:magnesium transporter [Anaerohalosphaera lusitana]AQT69335.1 Magnesium transporter MgtE [Anaerohalosphaera lusitana]